jgi:hypothetical protein
MVEAKFTKIYHNELYSVHIQERKSILSVYNVYDFVIAVEGPADKVFSKEYGLFKISDTPQKVDLIVRVNEGKRPLPTQIWGFNLGMYIPFDEGEKILWYDKGVENIRPLDHFLDNIEFLMWWPDKTWLHAGAVEKDGKVYVFTGGGGVGKTSCVLNLLREGYSYLNDDWLIIGKGKAFPLPKRIHVFDYNLKDKEIAKRVLGYRRLYYLPMCKLLEYCSEFSPHRYMKFIFEKLRERTILRIEFQKIFPEAEVASPSFISKVFLLERKKVSCIEVKKDITSCELARKMAYYNVYEWNHMFREYYRYVYLFGIRNKKIENRLYHDTEIMNKTFETCDLYRVIVPEGLDLSKINLTSLLDID